MIAFAGKAYADWKAKKAVEKENYTYMVCPKKDSRGSVADVAKAAEKKLDFAISAGNGLPCTPAVLRFREG